jgi:hypothetical protein
MRWNRKEGDDMSNIKLCPDCVHDMCRAHWLHLDASGDVDHGYTLIVMAECHERTVKRALAAEAERDELRLIDAELREWGRGIQRRASVEISKAFTTIAELRNQLSELAESGTGYSQQTVDAIVKERDALRAQLSAQQPKPTCWICREPMDWQQGCKSETCGGGK